MCRNHISINTIASNFDMHGRLVSEIHSKPKAGYTIRKCEYYPGTDGVPGSLKMDQTKN